MYPRVWVVRHASSSLRLKASGKLTKNFPMGCAINLVKDRQSQGNANFFGVNSAIEKVEIVLSNYLQTVERRTKSCLLKFLCILYL